MFGLFKPKTHPHERGNDAVWMTDEERHRGVIADAARRLKGGERVIIGACDSATAMALTHARSSVAVEILEPKELVPARLDAEARGASTLTLLLAGLFGDPDYEEKLLIQCKELSFRILLHVHYSFTELVDAGIVAPGLEKQLRALGAREGKAISDTKANPGLHTGRLLTQAIAKARHKRAQP